MNDDPFERAVERAHQEGRRRRHERSARGNQLGFRIHLVVYVLAQLMLIVIWAINDDGYPWFLYPLLGWGIGLAGHYLSVRHTWRRSAPGNG